MQVFSLFGKSGHMEEVKPLPVLPMFCLIYAYGYGMSHKPGAIISEPDKNGSYQGVYLSTYEPGFFQIDKYTRPHSKKFGIGHYFDDDFKLVDPQEVEAYIIKANQAVKEKAEAERKKNEADKKEIAYLPIKYPFLSVNFHDDQKITKANLAAFLKHKFPKVKFSITKHGYSAFNVKYTNGPISDKVKAICDKFEDHETDMSGDYRDYAPSNFNKVFGGFKYVFEHRSPSNEIVSLKEDFKALAEAIKMPPYEIDNIFYRIINRTDIPVGSTNFKIVRSDKDGGSLEDLFTLTFEK